MVHKYPKLKITKEKGKGEPKLSHLDTENITDELIPLNKFLNALRLYLPQKIHVYSGWNHEQSVRPRYHGDYHEWLFITEGQGVLLINSQNISVTAGDIVFLRPADIHIHNFQISELQQQFKLISVHFTYPQLNLNRKKNDVTPDLKFDADIFNFFSHDYPMAPKLSIGLEHLVFEWLYHFYKIFIDSKHNATLLAQSYILQIILHVAFEYENSVHIGTNKVVIKKVIAQEVIRVKNYMDQNYQKDLSLTNLLINSVISPNYLGSQFKLLISCTIHTYLTKLRLGHARSLLMRSNKTALAIAFEVGFRDYKNFLKAFKKHMGVSPGYYRKMKYE